MPTKKKKSTAKAKKKTTSKKTEDELLDMLVQEESEETKSSLDDSPTETEKDEDFDGLSTMNYDIRDLPGVGATIAKKLVECGFASVNSIAITPKKILMEHNSQDCSQGLRGSACQTGS